MLNLIVRLASLGAIICVPLVVQAQAPAGTAIFQAIRQGKTADVEKLLRAGGNLNVRNEFDETPLMAAAWQSDAKMLELLIAAKSEVNAKSQFDVTALHRAATFEEKVRLLVAQGADTNAQSKLGNTALILAARKFGNSATVKLLLDKGADVNAKNVFGATALMAAAAAGDLDSVRILLGKGADVNAKPAMGGNGFIWGGGRTALMWAAFQGNDPLATLLIQQGAKVNDFTLAGGALTQAAWGGHLTTAKLLLEAGAQVNQRDLVANFTPLHWAASSEKSSASLVELLLSRGAEANAEGGQPVDNYLGVAQTPLMLARKRGDTPIVQALLKAGAKLPPEEKPLEKSVAKASTSDSATDSKANNAGNTVADAVQRALPLLTQTAEESVTTYLRHISKQDCVSCHQQQLPVAALSLAKSRNFSTDHDAIHRQHGLLKKDFTAPHIRQGELHITTLEVDLQTTFHPEPAIFAGYTSLVMSLEGAPAGSETDVLVHQLATLQHQDGHWGWNLPRPPIQASDITATAQAVHTIKTYAIPARQQELESRMNQARKWLSQAPAETNEERVHQLLGLGWAGAKAEVLMPLAEGLVGLQRADGGWGQLAGLDSDAYATGQSVYALLEAGHLTAKHPAIQKGISFLVRTQRTDGSWHVRRRAHPFQPPMDSGFPHGADGWISAAGTSWAVMALATAIDPVETRPNAPSVAAAKSTATPKPAQPASSTASVEFARDIKPLLERSCLECHTGERPKGGFKMSDRVSLLRGGNRGEPVVVPGKPEVSILLSLIQDQEQDREMPPLARRSKFPALTDAEIAKVNAWIAAGANWPEEARLDAPKKD